MDASVSIIICTRNQADSLRRTLVSIGKAIVPPRWNVELLVVDNGSSDYTREVVSAVRLSNVCLRYVNEPTTGLGYARNTGLRETSGEIILFTDDDFRVPLDWIEGMCRPVLDGMGGDSEERKQHPPRIWKYTACRSAGEPFRRTGASVILHFSSAMLHHRPSKPEA